MIVYSNVPMYALCNERLSVMIHIQDQQYVSRIPDISSHIVEYADSYVYLMGKLIIFTL